MAQQGDRSRGKRLKALARWLRQGGPEGLRTLETLGETPAQIDLPPPIEWEAPLWELFARIGGQWRYTMEGRAGLDFAVYIPLIERRGWDLERALVLLRAIEEELLTRDG